MIPLHANQSQTPFYFSFCKFYVAARGFERENRFYPAKKHATTPSPIRLYYTPVGALRCKNLRIANAERQTPPATLYGTSHMSSVEPVSRKRVRSVGDRFIKHCRNGK